MTAITGETYTLDRYRDRVLLVVNVASRCVWTSQYGAIEALYRRHREAGLVVLGFPCNQFRGQEPGSAAQIADFCSRTYGITFPMFARVDVNGPGTHPLYRRLKAERKGLLGTRTIKWNFTKFLVDREGKVVARFAPTDAPDVIEPRLVRLLAAPVPALGT